MEDTGGPSCMASLIMSYHWTMAFPLKCSKTKSANMSFNWMRCNLCRQGSKTSYPPLKQKAVLWNAGLQQDKGAVFSGRVGKTNILLCQRAKERLSVSKLGPWFWRGLSSCPHLHALRKGRKFSIWADLEILPFQQTHGPLTRARKIYRLLGQPSDKTPSREKTQGRTSLTTSWNGEANLNWLRRKKPSTP